MENERFELENVANTVEMAASSSQMLQIARKTDRTTDPKKNNGKNKTKQFRTHLKARVQDHGPSPYHRDFNQQ
jgi:hypothetical protein